MVFHRVEIILQNYGWNYAWNIHETLNKIEKDEINYKKIRLDTTTFVLRLLSNFPRNKSQKQSLSPNRSKFKEKAGPGRFAASPSKDFN